MCKIDKFNFLLLFFSLENLSGFGFFLKSKEER